MKLLHVIVSPNGRQSVSKKLGKAIIEALQHKYPGSPVKVRDLVGHPFPNREASHITSFYTPAESRTPGMIAALKHSDEVISEVVATE